MSGPVVTDADREFRAAILKHIIETLDRPCSEGDMPDDRNEAFDLFLARHRTAAEAAAKAEIAELVEALQDAISIIDDQLGGDFPDSLHHFRATLARHKAGQP